VRARTTALTSGRLGWARVGVRDLGIARASGSVGLRRSGRGRRDTAGGGRRRRRAGARRRGARWRSAGPVSLVLCLSRFFSKNLNRTWPSDEYQSCISNYQQHFLQRLYRVFLPRLKVIRMPTLDVSRVF
jgi:hypothetical protein